MALSMTGYGRGSKENNGRSVTVEAKSVNHKYIDFKIKSSGRDYRIDDGIRKAVKARFSRGFFDISVSIISESGDCKVVVNEGLLKGYMSAADSLSQQYGIKYPPSFGDLFQIKDIFIAQEAEWSADEAWPLIEEALKGALDRLSDMRKLEGEQILDDIRRRFDVIESLIENVSVATENSKGERFASLKKRIEKLTKEVELDESRIAQEAAALADRSDISEELTRLVSHLKQASGMMSQEGPMGRKLEFLLQEINRETNTVGSKTPLADITKIVVDIKSELEKIREQAQNLE